MKLRTQIISFGALFLATAILLSSLLYTAENALSTVSLTLPFILT